MMKVAIMQPYFFPYLGYFQLMNVVDIFVVYDNIKFTKKGWIQRNRVLLNGKEELFSLSLKKDSDFLDIRDRRLADDYLAKNKKILRKIKSAYSNAPYFKDVFSLVEECFLYEGHSNLFDFLLFSINVVSTFLGIKSRMITSSELEGTDSRLRNKYRIIHLCKKLNASVYVNPIGGQQLYNKLEFEKEGLLLQFVKMREIRYPQMGSGDFIPNLSIIDVLMYNSCDDIARLLEEYDLV
jgi:hypothetical protein